MTATNSSDSDNFSLAIRRLLPEVKFRSHQRSQAGRGLVEQERKPMGCQGAAIDHFNALHPLGYGRYADGIVVMRRAVNAEMDVKVSGTHGAPGACILGR